MTAILESGLLTLKAGLYNNVVCLYPTLTIEDELLENARSILDGVFKKYLAPFFILKSERWPLRSGGRLFLPLSLGSHLASEEDPEEGKACQ